MNRLLVFILIVIPHFCFAQMSKYSFEATTMADSIKVYVLFEVKDTNCNVTFTIKNNKSNNIFFDFEKPVFTDMVDFDKTSLRVNESIGIYLSNGNIQGDESISHLTCLKENKEIMLQFERFFEPFEKEKLEFLFELWYLDESFFKINDVYPYSINNKTEINNSVYISGCKIITLTNFKY
jgi:uncharacterized protein (DUF488 family)